MESQRREEGRRTGECQVWNGAKLAPPLGSGGSWCRSLTQQAQLSPLWRRGNAYVTEVLLRFRNNVKYPCSVWQFINAKQMLFFVIILTTHCHRFFYGLSSEPPRGRGRWWPKGLSSGQWGGQAGFTSPLGGQVLVLLAADCPLHHIFSLPANFVSN